MTAVAGWAGAVGPSGGQGCGVACPGGVFQGEVGVECAAALTPEATDWMTPAVTSSTLPAAHTPGTPVNPFASAWIWRPMSAG